MNIVQFFFCLDDSMALFGISICLCVTMNKHVERKWCCLCGHCFSPVFKKEKENPPLDQRILQKKTKTQTKISLQTWMLREPNCCKIFCAWVGCRSMSYSRLLPQQPLKETHRRSSHSLSAFIHSATSFGHRKFFWRHEILCCVSINWNFCAGDNGTAGQTVGSWMNIAQYCPQTIKYIVHPFNIATKRSTILCNNIL